MKRKIFLPVVLISAFALGANAQKIALTKGQKLEAVTTTKMNMEVMGQTIDNENSTFSNVEVKDVNANGYVFTNTIKRLTMKMNAMGQDVNFDSDKKEDMEGQIGQTLKDKIGATQEVQVNKKGKVSSTKDTSAKAAGGMADVMNMMGDMSNGQPYPLLIQLPAKSIKPGDSWTDSSGTTATLKTVTTYTLKSITTDGALVSFTGTMAKTGTVEQNGMEIQLDMSGTTKGETTYEAGSGLLKTSSSSMDLKGTMGIMGQNAPLSAVIEASVTAKKL